MLKWPTKTRLVPDCAIEFLLGCESTSSDGEIAQEIHNREGICNEEAQEKAML